VLEINGNSNTARPAGRGGARPGAGRKAKPGAAFSPDEIAALTGPDAAPPPRLVLHAVLQALFEKIAGGNGDIARVAACETIIEAAEILSGELRAAAERAVPMAHAALERIALQSKSELARVTASRVLIKLSVAGGGA